MMTDQNDYNNLLDTLSAISDDQLKRCPMPIGTYLQEAENLYHWASEDAEKLAGAGLSQNELNTLPPRIGALREAEARWQANYQGRQDAERQWAQDAPQAYALRDNLLRAYRYALRKDDTVLQQIANIAEGTSHADMIQDLTSLAALGRQHTEALAAIHFDLSQLDTAAHTADAMAQLLAKANGDQSNIDRTRTLRDQAYTYLKEIVDELRACGKYVFFGDADRLKGYGSVYYRKKSRQKRVPNEAPAPIAD